MRRTTTWTWTCVAFLAFLAAPAGGQERPRRVPETSNLLTQYLDWADIHPPRAVGRLTIFPRALSRQVPGLGSVLTMQQALSRGLLAIEELDRPRVSSASFTNKSRDRMIFLMAGEMITGGRQSRTLQVDALLGPDSTTVLPLYCVQKGRWAGGKRFGGSSGVAPQRVREMAAAKAGQEAVWSEVARANDRLKAQTDSQDLAAAMDKPETARRLAELRAKVVPDLPRGCVGIVVAWRGRIVGADLLNSPELFADLRDKILDSYLSQYGWPLPVRESARRPEPDVTGEQVRGYLRGCYRSRLVSGERYGVGRAYHLRGERSGHVLGYDDRVMVHTALSSPQVLPVRPVPVPLPRPRPIPRPMESRGRTP